MDMALIQRLAQVRGIGDAYHDYRGELKYFSLDTKIGILRAMGCSVDDPAALASEVEAAEATHWRAFLPSLAAVRGNRAALEINISAREFGSTLLWSVDFEDGSRREGVTSTLDCPELWRGEVDSAWMTRRRFTLPIDFLPGYHNLEVKVAGGAAGRCLLIVSPLQCFEPPAVVAGARLWGPSVQLYTIRSNDNWGIGDFGDLMKLIRWMAGCGAGFIGLNPLHALSPSDPARASPYSASSRHFLNVLYICVPAVMEFEACTAAQARVSEPEFAARLAAAQSSDLVDYPQVADLKFDVLEILYRDFSERYLSVQTERGTDFRAFVAAGGAALQAHARFDALDGFFRTTRECASGWFSWPEEYRDVNGRAAARFAAENAAKIEFYLYLQWLAHQQLRTAQALTRELGMPIGLYGDYAVGANPAGSETWADRDSFKMGAEIGAPPDPLALKGQGWGIPPQDPASMKAQKLQGFRQLLRNNMQYYGALRLDHVMSLFRLWWVPAGSAPTEGAYVHYPLHQLLTVLALESSRAKCLVVGEDLGVVPDEMRVAMPEFGLYHYKVLLFEQLEGRYRRPNEYARCSLATVTTHDMPTLRSYWECRDIDLRRALDLYPSAEIEHGVLRERERDRGLLLNALREQGLCPAHPNSGSAPFTPELAQALHLYLARTTAVLAALQLEDLLGMTEPVNVPGTDHQYPNWQRKLSAGIEAMSSREDFARSLQEIDRTRRMAGPA